MDNYEFVELCIKKGNADESEQYKIGNKCYSRLMAYYYELKSNGNLNILEPLLKHEDCYVRLWSASFLLNTNKNEAERTLKDLCKLKGLISITAEMTLSEWEKGRLTL